MKSHNYAFDSRLEHRAAASAALTADTTFTSQSQRAATRTMFVTTVRVESIKISANDEAYNLLFEVSNDGFTNTETAAVLSLGATEARIGGAVDNAAGDEYDVHWNTGVNQTSFKEWRIRLDVDGTSPSIAFSMSSAC